MPDQRRHRGQHPADSKLFAAARLPDLRLAVAEYSWLLSRGYGEKAALKLVGDRYDLAARQRTAVMRCACADDAREARFARRIDASALAGAALGIDGYNLLITVESALAGGVILVGRDGCCRDLASVHGTYRKVAETAPALRLIMDHLAGINPARIDWYLDEPVSNSGRLKVHMAEMLEARVDDAVARWNIELSPSPDRVLRAHAGIVASCDSAVLDGCGSWVHLAGDIIGAQVADAWVVDLGVSQ